MHTLSQMILDIFHFRVCFLQHWLYFNPKLDSFWLVRENGMMNDISIACTMCQ